MKNILLVIDPQNDFCDIPSELTNGHASALPVPGSHDDMVRLAKWLDARNGSIDEIYVTLDSHNVIDIAHKYWWKNNAGEHPAPFTLISVEDVENGVWMPVDASHLDYAKSYVASLEAANKYKLIIWPEHCLIGTWGHNVHNTLAEALSAWSKKTGKIVNYVFKGMNPFTEHYSAIKAEVVLDDAHTHENTALLDNLKSATTLYVAGEALSHCVSSTVFDIVDYFDREQVKTEIVLFEDCSSPVGGFEEATVAIKEKMASKNVIFSKTL
ncbi:isochorismatase family protein [Serratia sp. Se-RSBMAAmG]|uniref:isochorismatase family protein n=1 Tax=Serratia sp. Se-RSBMAAmG TaxID=3043305 RepID=UPI0024AF7214|nr:isochorismatase family protein [Serratia sp. Se-RSBMAAmG]MDI6976609.1 isochorismatase family protein [Serratia sp. Se-RSBMAAmG]